MTIYIFNITSALLLAASVFASADQSDDDLEKMTAAAWRNAKQEAYSGRGNPADITKAGIAYKEMLARPSTTLLGTHLREKGTEEIVDFVIALAWANDGDYRKAREYLVSEANSHKNPNAPFLHRTRNHDAFALEVFKLESAIMAHTENPTPIDGGGYDAVGIRTPDGAQCFVFSFVPSDNEENGVVVGETSDTEEHRVLQMTAPGKNGKYEPVSRAYVIAERGAFSMRTARDAVGTKLLLSGISKVVDFIGEGVPVVHPSPHRKIELRVVGESIEQPLHALGMRSGTASETVLHEGTRVESAHPGEPCAPFKSTTRNLVAVGAAAVVLVLLFAGYGVLYWRSHH